MDITYTALIAEKDASDADVRASANENLDFEAPSHPKTRATLVAACLERGRVAFGIDWDLYEIIAIAHPMGDLVYQSDRYCRIKGH